MRLAIACIVILFSFNSCSPDPPPAPPPGSVVGNFNVIVTSRTQTEATIKWTKPSVPPGTVLQYKIYLSSVLIAQNHTDTNYVISNLLAAQLYDGRIVAYTATNDSSVANFHIPAVVIPPPPPPLETIQSIVIGTVHTSGPNTYSITYVYNPDLSLRWSKNGTGGQFAYHNGRLIAFRQDSIVCVDLNTGNMLWGQNVNGQYHYGMVVRYDTVYSMIKLLNNNNFMVARSAITGEELYSVFINTSGYSVDIQDIDGDLIAIRNITPNTVLNIDAFDVTTRSIKWSTPISASSTSGEYPRIKIAGNYFYSSAGGGSLYCLNRQTGSIVWTKFNYQYSQPVISNNRLFAMANQKLYAMNATTGTDLWEANIGTAYQLFGNPYVYGNNIYQFGGPGLFTEYNVMNVSTGAISLKKEVGVIYRHAVIAGNRLFTNGDIFAVDPNKVFVFDIHTGNKIDSLVYPSTINRPPIPMIVTSNNEMITFN